MGRPADRMYGRMDSVAAGKKEHALHLCGIFVGNVPVLVRAQLNVDPQAGCILKVRRSASPLS